MNGLFISATHKSSGKTTLSVGLAAALARRGVTVQTFKKGPDYIDPLWLSQAAGRPCRNLDFHTQSEAEILTTLQVHGGGADLALIEGNKGLFDGMDVEGGDSNAALARLLGAPVVLVIDTRGMTRGIAPLITGYEAFAEDLRIAGIILNQVGGARHEAKLRAAIEHYSSVPVVGAIGRHPEIAICERHLGLVPANEAGGAEATIAAIARVVEAEVDVARLGVLATGMTLADGAVLPRYGEHRGAPDVTIAIARDSAFGFYYPDDLEALERAGARLAAFDTMSDGALPSADGLLIGGGFPETHAARLAANRPLRQDIRQALENSMPAYAECGGMMYLCRSLTWQGERREMVGVIPADALMHERPVGRGYMSLRERESSPWPGATDGDFPAHEFHYASLEGLPADATFAYAVARGQGIDGRHDGLVIGKLLATFTHQRDTAANHWAERFVAYVRANRQRRPQSVLDSAAVPG